MDARRFDTLSRTLADPASRRGALATLLGGTLGVLGLAAATAKKKRKKRKKKRRSPMSCPDGQRLCKGTCLSVLICCDNRDCAGGRTCQQGTCGCPPATPVVCSGSTTCQQCCVTADCPVAAVPVNPTCSAARTCTCGSGATYCPVLRECSYCCADADCPARATCAKPYAGVMRACLCEAGLRYCTAAGRSGCVPETTPCVTACGAPCNPQNDTPCPCSEALVCDFDPANQEDGYRCLPR